MRWRRRRRTEAHFFGFGRGTADGVRLVVVVLLLLLCRRRWHVFFFFFLLLLLFSFELLLSLLFLLLFSFHERFLRPLDKVANFLLHRHHVVQDLDFGFGNAFPMELDLLLQPQQFVAVLLPQQFQLIFQHRHDVHVQTQLGLSGRGERGHDLGIVVIIVVVPQGLLITTQILGEAQLLLPTVQVALGSFQSALGVRPFVLPLHARSNGALLELQQFVAFGNNRFVQERVHDDDDIYVVDG
mmetsp:Transcript_10007/g.27682  ORF Transcript_10007/g.27682 Transcript_10007/m.27682 type:complete len:241 (-) Transcript_10007:396-1118(-)